MIEISEAAIFVGSIYVFLAGTFFGMWVLHSITKDVEKTVDKYIKRMK